MPPPSVQDVEVQATSDTTAVAIPNPLTCDDVPYRRARAGKFSGGVAAMSHSDMFKEPAPGKPKAKRWDHRLSGESKSRQSTALKNLATHLATPGMLSLGGGLPASAYFPFESLEVKVPTMGQFSEEQTKETGKTLHIGKHDINEGKSAYDLAVALNYGQGLGSAQMVRWVTEHTEIIHKPPYQDWACVMNVGSTSATESLYRMFTERGDYILSEEYTFASAVETAHPLGCRVLGIKMDSEGMLPDALDEVLTNWDAAARNARKPFLVYTVPSGQNPTGATMGVQRRKDIYKLAQKHDLIILEDEPYYFLQMQPYTGADGLIPPMPKTHDEFIKSLVPSLLSLDTDGRVVRCDSFSKVIAPGSRCGWITGSNQVCERYRRHNEVSIQHPSGFTQVILHRLLDEEWGHSGYLDWLMYMRIEYTQRRNMIVGACEKYLPEEICSWTPPSTGMFHWIKLAVEKHPQFGKLSVGEIEQEVFQAALAESVIVAPGSFFRADPEMELSQLFFRATFASAPGDAIHEAIRRFGEAVRKEFSLSA